MEYLLFIFAKHETKQEEFVKIMAEEIVAVADSSDIKYYFGPESVIFTFKSLEGFENVSSFFQMILGSSGIVFFLQPYQPDKLSYWLDPDIDKHLFNVDNKNDESTPEEKIEFQKFIFGGLENDGYKIAEVDFDMFDDGDELTKIKNKKRIPTLNELLDKINDKGIKSLTKTEIELLNNYSK